MARSAGPLGDGVAGDGDGAAAEVAVLPGPSAPSDPQPTSAAAAISANMAELRRRLMAGSITRFAALVITSAGDFPSSLRSARRCRVAGVSRWPGGVLA